MSSINVNALLKEAQQSRQNYEKYRERKYEKIQNCKTMFNEKCDKLILKYFDVENPYSINSSLLRAVKKSGNTDVVHLYMNFQKNDFKNWEKFVPFKADEFGRNFNARPASCLKLFLDRAKELGYLPQISFSVWGNANFTVKFTLYFNETDIEKNSATDVADISKAVSGLVELNLSDNTNSPNATVKDENMNTDVTKNFEKDLDKDNDSESATSA